MCLEAVLIGEAANGRGQYNGLELLRAHGLLAGSSGAPNTGSCCLKIVAFSRLNSRPTFNDTGLHRPVPSSRVGPQCSICGLMPRDLARDLAARPNKSPEAVSVSTVRAPERMAQVSRRRALNELWQLLLTGPFAPGLEAQTVWA